MENLGAPGHGLSWQAGWRFFRKGANTPLLARAAASVYASLQLAAAAEREQKAAAELLQAQAERQNEAQQVGTLVLIALLAL